jgi:hypothetical protein
MVHREPVAVLIAGMLAVWAAVADHHLGTQTPLKFLRYCAGEATAEVIGTTKVKDRVCKTSELSTTLVICWLRSCLPYIRITTVVTRLQQESSRIKLEKVVSTASVWAHY